MLANGKNIEADLFGLHGKVGEGLDTLVFARCVPGSRVAGNVSN